MNLFVEYMSFDFSWFTTGPGILITLGLVCLLIGLVFLILSGKKDKGEKVDASAEIKTDDVQAVDSAAVSATEPTPVVVPQVEENTAQPVTEEVVQTPTEAVATPEIVNTEPVVSATPEVIVPSVESVPAASVENDEVVETPAEAVIVETPVEAVAPVVDVPTVEETPIQESTVSIYGGVSPQVNLVPAEEPKKVYGGADPLENTGALPRVEVPAEPAVAPVEVITPVDESVSEVAVPTVEVPVAPVVESDATVTSVAPSGDIETLEF